MKKIYLLITILLLLLYLLKMLNAKNTVIKTNNGWNLSFKMEEIANGVSTGKKSVVLIISEKNVFWEELTLSPHHELKKMMLSPNEYSTEEGEIIDFIFDKDKFSFKIKKYIMLYPEVKRFFYYININGNVKKESSKAKHESGVMVYQEGILDIQGIGVYLGPTNLKEKTEIEWKLIDKIIVPYQEID